MRAQADDFFKAYTILRKSGLEMNGPAVVNLAFALELYIKELYVVLKARDSNGKDVKAPRFHNILELFRQLPLEAQQEIRNYPAIQKLVAFYTMEKFPLYISQGKDKQPITDVFEQQIYKISDAFENWRYSYENGALTYEESTALALIEAVKSASNNARRQSAA